MLFGTIIAKFKLRVQNCHRHWHYNFIVIFWISCWLEDFRSFWKRKSRSIHEHQEVPKHFWIGFWLSRHLFLQGVQFFRTDWAIFRIKKNMTAKGEAPIPRMGKWLPGSGSNVRPPLRELACWTTRPHRQPSSKTHYSTRNLVGGLSFHLVKSELACFSSACWQI